MRTKHTGLYILFLGMMVLFLANCATYSIGLTDSMYKLLLTSKVSYDTSMKVVADMYRQGRITDADKAKVIEIGTIYAEAHNLAVKALASYEKTKSDTDQAKLAIQIELATNALAKLLEMLSPYLE